MFFKPLSKSLKLVAIACAGLALSGCSSSNDEQAQLEALASHRATILSASLPVEHGPLHIMKAKANGSIIEMMMIYNDAHSIPSHKLMEKSVLFYCTNEETKKTLEEGVSYSIEIRNPRGKLLVEQTISMDSCQ